MSGTAATLTILLICSFWIATGWPDGARAAALAAIACCLFASLDDPAPALKQFLVATGLALMFVGIGLFSILPRVHEFETLTLVLGAFFVPVGVLAALPATQSMGAGLGLEHGVPAELAEARMRPTSPAMLIAALLPCLDLLPRSW